MNSNKDFNKTELYIKDIYKKWGIPSSFFEENKTTNSVVLHKILKLIEGRVKEMNCRVMPTSFNADDSDICGFPYTLLPSWSSCEYALKYFKSNGVMSRLPLFWQIEANLHHACQESKAFVFLNEVENMPLGKSAILQAEVDTIVTDIDDAHTFSAYLLDNNVSYNGNWVIVHSLNKDIKPISEILFNVGDNFAQEIHIFPGVPIFDQCESLYIKKGEGEKKDEIVFHINDSYVVEEIDGNAFITTVSDQPFPLFRYKLPFSPEKQGVCKCGKELISFK